MSKDTNIVSVLIWCAAILLCATGIYACYQWRYPMQTWENIQSSGGIRIGFLVEKNGRLMLPVEYDITGREKVTVEPTKKNRELMIEDLIIRRQGHNLLLTVKGTLAVLVTVRTDVHFANLSGIPPGKYDVYYESVAPDRFLGKVEIQ